MSFIRLSFCTLCLFLPSQGAESAKPALSISKQLTREGMLIALSAPSGTGKSTIIRRLLSDDDGLETAVSVTTRPPRTGELEGRDYFFVTPGQFEDLEKNKKLVEKVDVYGQKYGITHEYVKAKISSGKDIVFDVNWSGADQIIKNTTGKMVTIFVLPPSIMELEKRLRTRATDKDEVIKTRLSKAKEEISNLKNYDYIIVNDDVEMALTQVKAIIAAERLKRERLTIPEVF